MNHYRIENIHQAEKWKMVFLLENDVGKYEYVLRAGSLEELGEQENICHICLARLCSCFGLKGRFKCIITIEEKEDM